MENKPQIQRRKSATAQLWSTVIGKKGKDKEPKLQAVVAAMPPHQQPPATPSTEDKEPKLQAVVAPMAAHQQPPATPSTEDKEKAAILIQATFRGTTQRKKYNTALIKHKEEQLAAAKLKEEQALAAATPISSSFALQALEFIITNRKAIAITAALFVIAAGVLVALTYGAVACPLIAAWLAPLAAGQLLAIQITTGVVAATAAMSLTASAVNFFHNRNAANGPGSIPANTTGADSSVVTELKTPSL
ncbi:MAG: hypothetical protein Q8R83_10870 [Legionellaceae bacterium]|nr:hypothetical protein [Legionellaceae bacterium]